MDSQSRKNTHRSRKSTDKGPSRMTTDTHGSRLIRLSVLVRVIPRQIRSARIRDGSDPCQWVTKTPLQVRSRYAGMSGLADRLRQATLATAG